METVAFSMDKKLFLQFASYSVVVILKMMCLSLYTLRIRFKRKVRHGPFDIQGGGAWNFCPGREFFFGQNRSKIFFSPALWAGLFFS